MKSELFFHIFLYSVVVRSATAAPTLPEDPESYLFDDYSFDEGSTRFKETGNLDSPKIDIRWPLGIVHYKLEEGFGGVSRDWLNLGIDHLSQHTCIKFQECENCSHFVLVKSYRGFCESSWLGRRPNGTQSINIGEYCRTLGNVVHELMHVLGFIHEHQRADRESYIMVNFKMINIDFHSQFRIRSSVSFVGKFDYGSVMMYPKFGKHMAAGNSQGPFMSARLGAFCEDRLGNRKRPTSEDIRKINLLYECKGQHEHCEIYPNTDVVGTTFTSLTCYTNSQCCMICNETPDCSAFTWRHEDGGTCFLHESVERFKDSDNINAGVPKNRSVGLTDIKCQIKENDKSVKLSCSAKDYVCMVSQCQKHCEDDALCFRFSLNNKEQRCYLLSDDNECSLDTSASKIWRSGLSSKTNVNTAMKEGKLCGEAIATFSAPKNEEECAKACYILMKSSQCRHFTYSQMDFTCTLLSTNSSTCAEEPQNYVPKQWISGSMNEPYKIDTTDSTKEKSIEKPLPTKRLTTWKPLRILPTPAPTFFDADENLLECCKANGVKPACIGLCKYKYPGQMAEVCDEVYDRAAKCMTDHNIAAYCKTNGQDETACCKAQEFPEICLQYMCNGNARESEYPQVDDIGDMFAKMSCYGEKEPLANENCLKPAVLQAAKKSWKKRTWKQQSFHRCYFFFAIPYYPFYTLCATETC